jgi:hypothetical protein
MNKKKLQYSYFLSYFVIFIFFFTIYKQIALIVIPAPVDDLLYLKNAINLLQGKWIGEYNQYTLSKGIGYSIFLSFAYIIDISAKNFEYIFYSLVSLYFAHTCSLIFKDKKVSIIIFFFLISNPFLFNYEMARIVREGFYASLTLLLFTNIVNIICLNKTSLKYIYEKKITIKYTPVYSDDEGKNIQVVTMQNRG